MFLSLKYSNLEFVSDLGFRISGLSGLSILGTFNFRSPQLNALRPGVISPAANQLSTITLGKLLLSQI